MDRVINIGIIYSRDKVWAAGAYYIENIIKCINRLEQNNKPTIHAFCKSRKEFQQLKRSTGYPKLVYKTRPLYGKIAGKLVDLFTSKLLKKQPSTLFKKIKFNKSVEFVYPANVYYMSDNSKSVAWIPDLQELHLPELFSDEYRNYRDCLYKYYIDNDIPIIFSSKDALTDFEKHYKHNKTNLYVLNFAVIHPDYSFENINSIRNKYKIDKPYLLCANQFWKHKNHKFLFESYANALKKGLDLDLVCTGQIFDKRDPEYGKNLIELLKKLGIENRVKILGFIERTEQLCLMKNSYALIQPSLFEGWNTTVEDAKCLNKFIFLSDINVHKEQAPCDVCFFNPNDINDLTQKLLFVKPTETQYDYSRNVMRCGADFLSIINSFVKSKQ